MVSILQKIAPYSTTDDQYIHGKLNSFPKVHPEVVDRIYILTCSAIAERCLSIQFALYGSSLDYVCKESGFRSFEDMVIRCDQFHFLQVYVMKEKNQKFVKVFFNEEGYNKIKEAQKYFGHISDLRRPEGAIQIKYEDMCLFHQRYDDVFTKGRLALVNLLSLRYEPGCINSFPIDIVNRLIIQAHEEEDISNIGEFRRKYFPGVSSLSSVINRFCFEEIEFVDAIFTLKVDPDVFKKELMKKIQYRKTFFNELDVKLKELTKINSKPYTRQASDPKNLPRFCRNRNISVSEFEDDVRNENQSQQIQSSEIDSESSKKLETFFAKKESPIVMCFHQSTYNQVIPKNRTSMFNLCPSEDEGSDESKESNCLENIATNRCSKILISPREEEPHHSKNILIDKQTDTFIPNYEDVESDD